MSTSPFRRPTAPAPGEALVKAATDELARIARATETIRRRRDALRLQLAEAEGELAELSQREALLRQLVATPTAPDGGPSTPLRAALKGRDLRRIACRLLWTWHGHDEIHYREWCERVLDAGYAVTGKDPTASFLTNVRDSPAVQRGTLPGHYRLDPTTLPRAEQEAREIRDELEEIGARVPADEHTASQLANQRVALERRAKRLESDLEELRGVFA